VVFGAAALNCYMERDVDALMERTKYRALPAGRFNPEYAFRIGTLMILVSLALIYKTINPITAFLSALSALLYLGAYTPLKKYSWFALVVGAVPGAIPPVLGWTAVTGRIDGMAVVLFLIIFVWQLPHFMAISLFHAQDYHAADIKVLPNVIGPKKTKWLILFTTAILFVISLAPKYFGSNGNLYQVAALILSSLFLILAFAGFFQGKDLIKQRNWARKYFWASIIYLPLLFAAIVFLK
jgi:protoheme IX farnesyltransferase